MKLAETLSGYNSGVERHPLDNNHVKDHTGHIHKREREGDELNWNWDVFEPDRLEQKKVRRTLACVCENGQMGTSKLSNLSPGVDAHDLLRIYELYGTTIDEINVFKDKCATRSIVFVTLSFYR